MTIVDIWNAILGKAQEALYGQQDLQIRRDRDDYKYEYNYILEDEALNESINVGEKTVDREFLNLYDREKKLHTNSFQTPDLFYCYFFFGENISPVCNRRKENFFTEKDSDFEKSFINGFFHRKTPIYHSYFNSYNSLLCGSYKTFQKVSIHLQLELAIFCNGKFFSSDDFISLLIDNCVKFISSENCIAWIDNKDLIDTYKSFALSMKTRQDVCDLLTAIVFGYIYKFNYEAAVEEKRQKVVVTSLKKEKSPENEDIQEAKYNWEQTRDKYISRYEVEVNAYVDAFIKDIDNKREKLRECIIKWLKSKKPLFPPPNEPEQQSGKVRIISQQVADNGRTKENQRSIDKELSSDEELSSALGNMLKRMSKETLMRKLAEASYNLSKSIELEHEQENRR